MHCTHCGNKLADGAKFCTSCGNKTGDPVASSVSEMGAVRRMWNGRIARMNYFLGTLFGILPLFGLVALWGAVRLLTYETDSALANIFFALIPIFITLALLWWGFLHLCLAIRRCHDIGVTGWVSLLAYIPYLGLIPALVFLFKRGEEGPNLYGSAPRDDRRFIADVLNTK